MITGLLSKLGIAVLGLGTVAASGYGVYELARTKSIEEILSRSYKVLKTDGNDDNEAWEKIVNKYKTSGEDKEPKKISSLETTPVSANKENLKAKCKELLKKSYVNADDQDYIDAKNWCTDIQIKGK